MRRTRILWIGLGTTLFLVLAGATWLAASFCRLRLPQPSGPYAVGRVRLSWVDAQRHETFRPQARREVIAEVWYPAKKGSGHAATYFPELASTAGPLVKAGELTSLEAWGLSHVRSHARVNAEFAPLELTCPVIIFSPGNATNVELYAAIGEDLASHGCVVVGMNHPYDVSAVRLRDGAIAVYRQRVFGDNEALTLRMRERASDMLFVLDRLPEINAGMGVLARRLDLSRVALMGHSLGGLTAAEVCLVDPRPAACINMDGLYAGNPYGAHRDADAPPQPFLYLGKERTMGSRTAELLDRNDRAEVYRLHGASHESFQDGSLFRPTVNPWDGTAQRHINQSRRAIVQFLENRSRADR